MQNTQNKSAWILAAIIVIILIAAIWYKSTHKTARIIDSTQPVITILSPNGRESYAIGDTVLMTFDVAGEVRLDQFVAISIEPGAAPIALTTATTTQFAFKIPASILIGGDAMAPLVPGKYKFRTSLYQGRPCLGHCVASYSKMLGYDETDGEVTVTKATITSTGTTTKPQATY